MGSLERGLSLIEILVTVVVTSLGLLGIAALQARGLQSNYDAYLYSQASALAYDMAERIRANPTAAAGGSYNTTMTSTPTTANCVTSQCGTPAQIAAYDKYDWKENHVKVLLPEASASINYAASDVTIVIRWRGRAQGNCDSDGSAGTAYTCFTLTLRPA